MVIVKSLWLSWWLSGKEFTQNAGDTGDMGSSLGLGRYLGGGNGNPLHYSYLKSSMDGGVWWATVQRAAKSPTWLSNTIEPFFNFFLLLTLHSWCHYWSLWSYTGEFLCTKSTTFSCIIWYLLKLVNNQCNLTWIFRKLLNTCYSASVFW